jgi:hypothetical protein
MRKGRLIVHLFTLLLLVASVGQAQVAGPYLVAHGVTATVWLDYYHPFSGPRDYGRFDPSYIHPDIPQCLPPAVLGAPAPLPLPACIHAYNQRYGSAAGGGRLTAPWLSGGTVVGERGCTQAANCDLFQKWWSMIPELAETGPPTDIDLWDTIMTDAWDTLVVPGAMGIVPVPGSPPADPCSTWTGAFEAWLKKQPPVPPSGNLCSSSGSWLEEFVAWISEAPQPPTGCAPPAP